MMKMLSKIRNASRVRNSRATMMAAFMLGMVTRHIRCHQVAPSTLAASCSTSGTWARPARSSREMNGVVFQISARQITNSEEAWPPNQSRLIVGVLIVGDAEPPHPLPPGGPVHLGRLLQHLPHLGQAGQEQQGDERGRLPDLGQADHEQRGGLATEPVGGVAYSRQP